jgi:peptidase, S41 family
MKNKSYFWLPFALSLAVVLGVLAGKWIGVTDTPTSSYLNTNKLDAVLDYIDTQYVDTIDNKELLDKVIPKILSELDPHSSYIPAEDLETVNEELEGSFSGIGIQFNLMNDTINIVSVISGGPSEKAGILPGDRIISVNDSAFVGADLTNERVLSTLRGKKGSTVVLGIKRNTSPTPLRYEITRGDIPVNSVDASFILEDKIGYVKISKFGRTTYDEFLTALIKLKKFGAESFIIDLRSNSGGYMDAAINMVNEFLPGKQLIVYTEGKAFPREEARSNGIGSFQNEQLIVLTDEWSASASEIFAGAIQDNDRGLIVGRRSFGKGLVQRQIPLSDGSAVRLTIARYYTPSGRSIQKQYEPGHDDEYSMDIVNRYMHGEFFNEDSIKQNKDLKYYTANGREVYGGGGIMPDIFVARDTTGESSYYNQVINSGALYQYAFDYTDKHREHLSQAQDAQEIVQMLNEQALLNDFVNYAKKKGILPRQRYIQISRKPIVNLLQALIARNILGEEAYFQLVLRNDPTLDKAKTLLRNGEGRPVPPQTAHHE